MSVGWAVAAGVFAYQAAEGQWSPWLFGAAVVGLLSGNPWTMLLVVAVGVAGFRFHAALAAEAQADVRRLEAEMFLRRLRHQVRMKGSVGVALAAVGVSGGYRYGDDAVVILGRLAERYRSHALAEAAFALGEAERHGGSLDAVLDDVLREVQRERRRIYRARSEEEGSRTTMAVLAGVPVVAVFVIDVAAHALYRDLVMTAAGHAGLAWIAASTLASVEVMVRHMDRRDGDGRWSGL